NTKSLPLSPAPRVTGALAAALRHVAQPAQGIPVGVRQGRGHPPRRLPKKGSQPGGRRVKFARYTHLKKGYAMEPLPVSFRDRGFFYEQLERQGDVALYSQTNHAG